MVAYCTWIFENIVNKEHISVFQEPCSKYISYITTITGTRRDSFRSVFLYLSEKFLDDVVVVGSDETSNNTGLKKKHNSKFRITNREELAMVY